MDPFKQQNFEYTLGEQSKDSIAKVKAHPPPGVNFFAFELDSRKLIEKLLEPIIESQKEDRKQVISQQKKIQKLQQRCTELEVVFD